MRAVAGLMLLAAPDVVNGRRSHASTVVAVSKFQQRIRKHGDSKAQWEVELDKICREGATALPVNTITLQTASSHWDVRITSTFCF